MKKKISLFFMVIVMCLSVLSGCSFGNEGVNSNAGVDVALFDGDDANFIIIRPADANEVVRGIASDLRQRIISAVDVAVAFKPDTIEHKEGQLEINIGVTNRPDAQAIYDEVVAANKNNGMDWAIRVIGDYIYIVGATDDALQFATETFFGNFLRDRKATIKSEFAYMYHMDGKENLFALNGTKDLTDYSIVTPQYNMSYLAGREIKELQSEILHATGSNLAEKIDTEKESDCEIVIGHADRKGVPECKSEDEYRIKMVDKKLFVNGGSDASMAIAVKELTRMVKEGEPIDSKTDIKGTYTEAIAKYEDYYSLTFSDEFDTFDKKIWTTQTGPFTNSSAPDKPTFMSDSSDMIYTEDGNLIMKAKQTADGYYSSEIRTTDSVWYKYGLIEIRAKINCSKGICPAFWLLGFSANEYYSEIDIFECFGNPTNIKATPLAHVDKSNTTETTDVYYCGAVEDHMKETFYRPDEGDSFADEYHTFGLEWDENSMRWVFDGRVFLEIDTTVDERARETFNGLQQIIFSVYGGCNVAKQTGFPDASTDWENNGLTVDSLRLYQLPGQELAIK